MSMATYYRTMAGRNRLLMLHKDGNPWGICTFFILHADEELPRFYDRQMWSVPVDAEEGPTIYIDKLVTYGFDRELWEELESVLTERVPQWKTICWYRPRRDRDVRYTYRRRRGALCKATR